MLTVHAEGAQIYECKAGEDGKLAWSFREPIATLVLHGKTVGRHYAGPNWDHIDGSGVTAQLAGKAPGAMPGTFPGSSSPSRRTAAPACSPASRPSSASTRPAG